MIPRPCAPLPTPSLPTKVLTVELDRSLTVVHLAWAGSGRDSLSDGVLQG